MRSAIDTSVHISFAKKDYKPLDVYDVFYLATLGGAQGLIYLNLTYKLSSLLLFVVVKPFHPCILICNDCGFSGIPPLLAFAFELWHLHHPDHCNIHLLVLLLAIRRRFPLSQ